MSEVDAGRGQRQHAGLDVVPIHEFQRGTLRPRRHVDPAGPDSLLVQPLRIARRDEVLMGVDPASVAHRAILSPRRPTGQ
jgi:hypothetical protein